MAWKLEDLVGPWERVVFRTVNGRGPVAIRSAILALLILASFPFILALAFSNPINSPAGIASLFLTLFAGFVCIQFLGGILRASRREVIVTERRLLYRHGTWRSKATEVELADITGIIVRGSRGMFGQMALIERGQRGAIAIWPLQHLDQMSNIIAGLTPISVPRRNEKAVRHAIIYLGVGALLGGMAFGLLPTLGLFFLGGGGDIEEFGTIIWNYVFFYPAQTTHSAIAVAVAGVVGFVGYLWLISACFFAGYMLGSFPVVAIFRYVLTPAQTQMTICSNYPSLPSEGVGKVFRWHVRQKARFASWLYGQEIRCE